MDAHQLTSKFWDDVGAMRVSKIAGLGLVAVCGVCGLAYGASRLFLVIEAFISIRALPPKAYDTPDWSQVLPHL